MERSKKQIKLLEVTINKYLLLENFPFFNLDNDIDSLNSRAIANTDINEALSLLNLATHKIEKFHSFFHFEQSFFHLQLAIRHLKNNKNEEAKAQLELAVFQDHTNNQAIGMLNNSEEYQEYKRVYPHFNEYLKFATSELGSCSYNNTYWNDTDEEQIIEKLRFLHLNYHQESAKLYLNRAIIFTLLGKKDLAKNDLVKANNLDNKLKEKPYYSLVISILGTKVVLGLGSNLGNRELYLKQAITKLEELEVLTNITCSSIEETKAVLKPNSPTEWNLDYLNMAVTGLTLLSPEELQKTTKNIEHIVGREGSQEWAPREIDIDILAYGDKIINQEDLIIPHAELLNRPWALKPFAEIYPEWKYPVLGPYYQTNVKSLYENCCNSKHNT